MVGPIGPSFPSGYFGINGELESKRKEILENVDKFEELVKTYRDMGLLNSDEANPLLAQLENLKPNIDTAHSLTDLDQCKKDLQAIGDSFEYAVKHHKPGNQL